MRLRGERISRVGGQALSEERKRTGLNPAELRIVLAVMACERAEFGNPSMGAIEEIAGVSKRSVVNLCGKRWLEKADKEGRVHFYRATRRAWSALGITRPQQLP